MFATRLAGLLVALVPIYVSPQSAWWYMGTTSPVYTTTEKVYVTFNYEGDPGGASIEVFYSTAQAGPLSESNLGGKSPVTTLKPKLKATGKHEYASTTVVVPATRPGYYVIRATIARVTRTTSFYVSDIGLVSKSGPGGGLVWVVNRLKGEPVRGALVKAVSRGSSPIVLASGFTDASGLWRAPELTGEYELVASAGEHVARHRPYLYEPADRARIGPGLVYLYTDRSVYRPGDTVYYKGIARDWVAGEYVEASGRAARVELRNNYDTVLETQETNTTASGSFEGSFRVSEFAGPGTYSLSAQIGELRGDCSFDVAEYRKPEYRVTLTPSAPFVVTGDVLTVRLEAKYYFGAPLPNAGVRWSVLVDQDWEGWNRFVPQEGWQPEWDEERETDNGNGYAWGESRQEGTGRTGPDGIFTIRVPTSFPDKLVTRPMRITVSAEVLDIAGRERSTSVSIPLLPASRFAEVKPSTWVGAAGEPVDFLVSVFELPGVPVEGAVVQLRLIRTWWVEERNTWHERYEIRQSQQAVTGPDGSFSIRFVPTIAGNYRLEAEVRDAKGRVGKTEFYYWAHGAGEYRWGGAERLQIQASSREATPGDTLTVMFRAGQPNAVIWYTVEGTKIHHSEVVRASDGSAVVQIPITSHMAPVVYIWAGTSNQGILQYDQIGIWVVDRARLLQVSVYPDRKWASPGDTVRYRIETRDNGGNPVPAEVSLALVDESLFAIRSDRTPDIRNFFYGARPNAVTTSQSEAMHFRVVQSTASDAVLSRVLQKEAKEAREKQVEGRVRREFRDTALWVATVATDESGRAEVECDLPDNLTQWRATVRAVGSGTAVGQALNKELQVTKPLVASLNLPRFVSVGDRFRVIAVVRNTTEVVQRVELHLEVSDHIAILSRPDMLASLPPNGERRYDISVEAKKAGTALAYLAVRSELHEDAVELRLQVLEYRNAQTRTVSGTVVRATRNFVPLPKERTPGSESLELRLAPNLTSVVLGSVEELAAYPYGCIEQTTSPLMADLALLNLLRSTGLERPELVSKLEDMVRTGLARIYAMQSYDDGWGWGDESESDPYWTAYVMKALVMARRTGFQVNSDAFRRGLDRLGSLVVNLRDTPPTGRRVTPEARWRYLQALHTKVVALETLAAAQPGAWRNALERMALRKDELPDVSLARLALALKADGAEQVGRQVLGALIARAKRSGDQMWWPSENGEGSYWWHFGEQQTRVTAEALQAMCGYGWDRVDVDRVLAYLLATRRGGMWYSTNDTTAIAGALTAYICAYGERPFVGRATLLVNGEEVQSWDFTSTDGAEIVVRVGPERLQGHDNIWELRLEGSGTLRYSAVTRYNLPYPQKPAKDGIEITRTYHKLTKEWKVHRSGDFSWTSLDYGITSPITVAAPGDEVVVKLEVRSDRYLRHMILEDPLPAGLEPIDEENSRFLYEGWLPGLEDRWNGGYARREQHDNRITLLLEDLPAGKSVYYYVVRAVTPGEFRTGPAVLTSMYGIPAEGHSAGGRITVRP